jgi:hypothetical protein
MTEPTPEYAEIPPRRRGVALLLGVLAAVLLLGIAAAVPVLVGGDETETHETVIGEPLAGVETFELGPPKHAEGKVGYSQVPPVGGDHNPVWLECGRYAEPVRDEFAVHNLEHGTVWITHRPDLSDQEVSRLADALPADGIMSPYAGLPTPVVVTVWGIQLRLDGADDPRLAQFLELYGDGASAPEAEASCAGGVGNPVQEPLTA